MISANFLSSTEVRIASTGAVLAPGPLGIDQVCFFANFPWENRGSSRETKNKAGDFWGGKPTTRLIILLGDLNICFLNHFST